MKSTPGNNSDFFIELIPLDQTSSLNVESLSDPAEVPLFDFNSGGPLPVLDTSPAVSEISVAPASPIADSANLVTPLETIGLDDNISICSCPNCHAPVSVRNWLLVTDCWSCHTSIKIAEALEQKAIASLAVPAGDYAASSSIVASYLKAYEANQPIR